MATLPSPDPWYVLRGHQYPVSAVSFYDPPGHPAGSLLLSGDGAGEVRLWDLRTKRPAAKRTEEHANKGILSTLGLRDGTIMVQGREGTVSILQLTDGGELKQTAALVDDRPGGLCFCPSILVGAADDTPLLAIPAYDPSQISLFDLRERKRTALLTLPAADAPVGMCMSIRAVPGGTDPLGANVVAGYEDGSVIGWDLRNRAMLWRSKLFDEPAVAVAVGLSKSGGCRVVAGGAGDTLHIGKLPTRAADSGAGEGNPVSQLRDLKTIQLKHAGINSISIRDDGKLFATAGWDNRVRLFSWPKCSPLAILGYHRAAVNVVSWSNAFYEVDGGKLLAAGSKDTCISLWSVYQP